ncbi:DNA polymerase III subunit epsilon [Psychrobacter arenosus]|uniref:DNA polymerase III subunit epsilon n=1 Tax=Psychrobacter arenosus TaxID=256326 RepID=UPI0019190889|nr:DNA polymerase III subunit epsilon [Psychrobacter arenosus]
MSVLDAKANTTVAFTDGACKGNPGAGGWGAFLVFADGQTQAWCGGDKTTTNNRMELMGAIQALQNSPRDVTLELWTDSSYVKNGITQWIEGWKKKGWKTSGNKPVANQDLWQQLDSLCQGRDVSWHWVKGHAGHAGNEKADELANLGVERVLAGAPEPFNSTGASVAQVNAEPELNSAATAELKKNTNVPDQDDWLAFDPLGLDMADELPEDLADELPEDFANELLAEDLVANGSLDNGFLTNDNLLTGAAPSHNLQGSDLPSVSSPSSPSLQPYDSTPMTQDHVSAPNTDSPNMPAPIAATENNQMVNEQTIANETEEAPVAFDGDTSKFNPHFVPLLPEPIHRGRNARQLIMDTETTGLDAGKGDRIIEVGIVEMIGRKFTGEKLHVYINPERGMDEGAIRVHGISEAFLQDKPKFAEVAQQLFDFMAGAEVIAHNAPFDMGFLSMEFDRVGLNGFADTVQVTDSLVMAKQQYPGQRNTLDALVRRLNVGKQDRTFHGALLDAEILAEVYLAMTGGQVALAIDEDIQSDGGGSHATFAQLAAQLVASPVDTTAHEAWLAELSEQYPALKEVW